MSNIQVVDAPPTRRSPRPKKYADVYAACLANPGRWCVWSDDFVSSGVVSLRQTYPGVQFTMRNLSNQRGTLWGSYVGGEGE